MTEYQIEVHITPREGLLDPEGKAVEHALQALAFEGVGAVRVGRLVRLHISAGDEAAARARAEEMCRKLLANPVTEDFSVALAGD
ncbi:MAG TPA: phosphoribosylformylglycinamidine synthase subunit PurS [Longimicrobiales bacterium]|nr:phosphoribosylformylglycinamidine synthase subunit PurS [Longimicrobiales bacterium]